jgi:hypothetical protein
MRRFLLILFICCILLNTIVPVIYYSMGEITDFNFIFKYDVGGSSVLNTYDNTYTRSGAPYITMKLDKFEVYEIFSDMKKIDIFNYPESFPEYIFVTPKSEFYLEVTYKKEKKVIKWTSDNMPPFSIDTKTGKIKFDDAKRDKYIINLQKMVIRIMKIIEAKPEYKNLPERKALYAINN